ncbi:type IV secretory pathway protease TraF [Chryseobacterium rhizosphaerae]|jgi:type IV secretory pathway protease TraF|nr:type IV secretory pathway protease TraF [Chryseobacterium rhizosphaerae]
MNKTIITLIIILIIFLCYARMFSQVGIYTENPHFSIHLELYSFYKVFFPLIKGNLELIFRTMEY